MAPGTSGNLHTQDVAESTETQQEGCQYSSPEQVKLFTSKPTSTSEPIQDEDWEDYIPEPPDGGWGWVVMIASFVNNFILDGIAYCFGIFLQSYINEFGSSVASTSLANSLLCGVYLLVGPVVGALVNKFGCRPVGIAGSLVGAGAFILSIFSPSVAIFQITYGVIGGFGFGMMYLPAVVGVGYYFEKKRGIATGVAVCGTGIGTFCMAPLGKLLLQHYDWRSAHIFLAGLLLQGCVSSALMRPITKKKRRKSRDLEKTETRTQLQPNTKDDVNLIDGSTQISKDHTSRRTRTISSTSFMAGSRLIIAESSTPADRLHASVFLNSATDGNISPGVNVENLVRPMYRKDIFYSGSIMNVSHVKSHISLKSYVASLSSIPEIQGLNRMKCLDALPKPIADILAEMLDLAILKNRGMLVLCAANVVGMMGFYVPIIFSSNRATALGVSEGALLLSIMGICNTIGRVLSGCISVIPGVSPLLVNNICVLLSGVSVLLTPFCNTFELMALASAAYGLFASTLISLAPLIMCQLVGIEKLTNGFGLLCLVRGITAIAGPPLEGMLYDWTGDYDATFYAGGVCLLLCGVLHLLLHLKVFKNKVE